MSPVPLYPTLRQSDLAQVKAINQTDLVIGLPTHQVEPAKVANVVAQAIAGVQTYYPTLKSTLINVDTGQQGRVRQAIQAQATETVPVITGRHNGILGRGAAISAILHSALLLKAKVIILLDGRNETFAPNWVAGLATLIINDQADLVKPRYELPPAESVMNDLIFYPFFRAVWGTNLQYPAAYDCALSNKLAQHILQQDVWGTAVNRTGFDVWLSTIAVMDNCWRTAQTALGRKEYATNSEPQHQLLSFIETVGTLLHQLHRHTDIWHQVKRCRSLPTLSQFATVNEYTAMPNLDATDEFQALALGWIEYRRLWTKILLPENLTAIEQLASLPLDQFYFPGDLWAKIVFDFAVVYNKGELDPDAIVASLYPLYLGRLAGFWPEIAGLTAIGRAGTVSAQGVEFEEHRAYLKHRWDTYKLGA